VFLVSRNVHDRIKMSWDAPRRKKDLSGMNEQGCPVRAIFPEEGTLMKVSSKVAGDVQHTESIRNGMQNVHGPCGIGP